MKFDAATKKWIPIVTKNKLFLLDLLFILMGIAIIYNYCFSPVACRKALLSDNLYEIDNACFYLGEVRDTASVKLLLTNILDPRRSTNLRFYGMGVNYCRLVALRKISGVGSEIKLNQFIVDTPTTYFYIRWAISHGYIRRRSDINIFYYYR
jgi:hypothetical protein